MIFWFSVTTKVTKTMPPRSEDPKAQSNTKKNYFFVKLIVLESLWLK